MNAGTRRLLDLIFVGKMVRWRAVAAVAAALCACGAAAECPRNATGVTVAPLLVAARRGDAFITLRHRVLAGGKLELTVHTNVQSWVGVGFSETGHMLGADFFVIRKAEGTGEWQVADYAMYWSAFPLLNPRTMTPVEPAPEPVLDQQQDWTVSCAHETAAKERFVTVERLLDTGDVHQDRPIGAALARAIRIRTHASRESRRPHVCHLRVGRARAGARVPHACEPGQRAHGLYGRDRRSLCRSPRRGRVHGPRVFRRGVDAAPHAVPLPGV